MRALPLSHNSPHEESLAGVRGVTVMLRSGMRICPRLPTVFARRAGCYGRRNPIPDPIPKRPLRSTCMLRATKDIKLPTTITGSLPRPSWFTENLGPRSFMEAMVSSPYREQYLDTIAVYVKEQE